MTNISEMLSKALDNRSTLLEKLHSEDTNSYRLFHGINEGIPGLTIDRYGDSVLVQTFREPLVKSDLEKIEEFYAKYMSQFGENTGDFFVYNHRGQDRENGFSYWHQPSEKALEKRIIKEIGLKYVYQARHRGQDPFLFLDMRAGRRFILNNSKDLSVLNLFSYTNATGVAAMAGGAKEVLNIDFAESSLAIGNENGKLNGFSDPEFKSAKSDVFSALRQFSGIPFTDRRARRNVDTRSDRRDNSQNSKAEIKFEKRGFDLVFLDPPAWSKSLYGTVDLIRDYQSIFKLSLLATNEGGRIICVNNVAKVELNEWLEILRRCGAKAGREIKNIEVIQPEADFPSPDKNFPLKIAVCEV